MIKEHTAIERYIIEAVKKRRLEMGINPSELAKNIGLNRAFIRLAEAYEKGAKYSTNHLNEISKVLNCKIADFFPEPNIEEDCIEEYREIKEARAKRKKNQK